MFSVQTEVADQEATIHKDEFLGVALHVTNGVAHYTVAVDSRRSFDVLETDRYVMLTFGSSSRPRKEVTGTRLWRDKYVVVQRYGRNPRSYLIVRR